MCMSTNWSQIVQGVRDQDSEAFSEMVDHLQEPLMRFCVYLCGDRQLAEDLCHDSLIKAVQSINQLKNPEQTPAWVKRIARNLFLDYKKSAAQSKPHLELSEMDTAPQVTAGSEATEDQILALQALQTLGEPERSIVIFVDIEGYSYQEVSQLLKINTGTIKSKISRARAKMLDFLGTKRSPESSLAVRGNS